MSILLRIVFPLLAVVGVAAAAPVNTACPMMPDEKIVDEDNVVEFNGQQVAMCCGKCKRQWGRHSRRRRCKRYGCRSSKNDE